MVDMDAEAEKRSAAALNDRVGGFTECTLTMACPVLLAVATKKVDLSSEGNAHVRQSIPWLAAISLFLCPVAFILLALVRVADDVVSESLKLGIHRCTKVLVLISAIGQMILAYMIFLLILNVKLGTLLCLLVLLSVWGFVVYDLGRWSVVKATTAGIEDWLNKKLQLSLDLSAAVTSILFLGLEGLALEGQNQTQTTKVGKDPDLPGLGGPVFVSFSCCVIASGFMLYTTVTPTPPVRDDVVVRRVIHCSWTVLAICLTLVVTMILVFELTITNGFVVVIVPIGVMFFFIVIYSVIYRSKEYRDDQLEPPPSLEMTKVTFIGFLAISLPSFRDGRLTGWTLYFIITAAMSVILAFGWRLLSHSKLKAAVETSKVARLLTHASLAAAAIELLWMAVEAQSG